MDKLKDKYELLCNKKSDINEHLPTLYKYAKECKSIIELGVRGVISSYALLYGLHNNNYSHKKLLLNDITKCNINDFLDISKNTDVEIKYIWGDDLHINIEGKYDLTFIDTWHVYGQLKRELNKYSKITNKYIIMHNTTVDEFIGETIRLKSNSQIQSINSGIPIEEINKGLWHAIEEFLENNKKWKIKERYINNNGLTILEKINTNTLQ